MLLDFSDGSLGPWREAVDWATGGAADGILNMPWGLRRGEAMSNAARKAAALRTLSRFVLRARLVQEHSLAQDKRALEKYAALTLTFNVIVNTKTGQKSVEMKPAPLLPTEQVESAAARVRPLFLKDDGVHYEKVLNSLSEMVAASPAHQKEVEVLRSKYKVADPDYPNGRPKVPRSEPTTSNKEVAGAWLYGHLLHEDEVRRSYAKGISAEEMLINATKTVCSEMLAAVETLHLIERLVVGKSLELPEELFTAPVTVSATEWAPTLLEAYVADVGTPMPSNLNEPMDGAWRKVQDEFGPRNFSGPQDPF